MRKLGLVAAAAAALLGGPSFEMTPATMPTLKIKRRRPVLRSRRRTQELICDRVSNIQKLQRSPIELMQPDERARKRHIHPRSKRHD